MEKGKLKQILAANSPVLALIASGAGYIGTAFLAARATKKAIKWVEASKEQYPNGKIPKKEIVKHTYKYYIPTVSMGIASTVLLCYAGASYEKRNRAAIAACALSETAFKEFKDAVEEKLTPEQIQEVYERVGENRIAAATPLPQNNASPDGKYWFLEPIGNHPFRSTPEEVKNSIAELNLKLTSDPFGGYISVEDYCSELRAQSPNLSGKVGWQLKDGMLDICISQGGLTDGTPCYTIIHKNPPRWNCDA